LDRACVKLADLDLDTYDGYSPIRSFAPKSRLNVRRVALLHPFDFIIYTSLALVFRDRISKARLSADKVSSYRAEQTTTKQLYNSSPSWRDFRAAVRTRITNEPNGFVGITDIADFFPRIYHHRLINALEAATGIAERGYLRALDKLLVRFSDGTSYGIPVGPPLRRAFSPKLSWSMSIAR
jgi:hypothetical protein